MCTNGIAELVTVEKTTQVFRYLPHDFYYDGFTALNIRK